MVTEFVYEDEDEGEDEGEEVEVDYPDKNINAYWIEWMLQKDITFTEPTKNLTQPFNITTSQITWHNY